MHNFEPPTCLDLEEFNDEIKRFRYITRAFKSNNYNTQLILNHIVILYNVFGNAATEMLLFKIEKEYWSYLMPFLIYLNRLSIEQIDSIMVSTILNNEIVVELRNL